MRVQVTGLCSLPCTRKWASTTPSSRHSFSEARRQRPGRRTRPRAARSARGRCRARRGGGQGGGWGAVAILVHTPNDAAPQIDADGSGRRVRADYVVTGAARRCQGIAAELVEAVEAWGRAKGAFVAEATTYRASPLSFPFWTS